MIGLHESFAPSYARARVKFLEAAAIAGMAIRSYDHPLKGREGETLAMDVALDGPADAENLLIVSSACHGVEGFCGSGVQVFAAHDAAWREQARGAGKRAIGVARDVHVEAEKLRVVRSACHGVEGFCGSGVQV